MKIINNFIDEYASYDGMLEAMIENMEAGDFFHLDTSKQNATLYLMELQKRGDNRTRVFHYAADRDDNFWLLYELLID